MTIGSDGDEFDDDASTDNKIPISTFRIVGFGYIVVFGLLSYLRKKNMYCSLGAVYCNLSRLWQLEQIVKWYQ